MPHHRPPGQTAGPVSVPTLAHAALWALAAMLRLAAGGAQAHAWLTLCTRAATQSAQGSCASCQELTCSAERCSSAVPRLAPGQAHVSPRRRLMVALASNSTMRLLAQQRAVHAASGVEIRVEVALRASRATHGAILLIAACACSARASGQDGFQTVPTDQQCRRRSHVRRPEPRRSRVCLISLQSTVDGNPLERLMAVPD